MISILVQSKLGHLVLEHAGQGKVRLVGEESQQVVRHGSTLTVAGASLSQEKKRVNRKEWIVDGVEAIQSVEAGGESRVQMDHLLCNVAHFVLNIHAAGSFSLENVQPHVILDHLQCSVHSLATVALRGAGATRATIRCRDGGTVSGFHVLKTGTMNVYGAGTIRGTVEPEADVKQNRHGMGRLILKSKHCIMEEKRLGPRRSRSPDQKKMEEGKRIHQHARYSRSRSHSPSVSRSLPVLHPQV
jgi:hypothetical protein